MIVARLSPQGDNGDKEAILMVLEPGNFAKLELGQPIVKKLRDFLPELAQDIELIIYYSPDTTWVGEQMAAGGDLPEVLVASLTRKPVYLRADDAEALVPGKFRNPEPGKRPK